MKMVSHDLPSKKISCTIVPFNENNYRSKCHEKKSKLMFQIKMRSQVKLSNLQYALFPLKWIIEHRARREDKPEQDIES